MESKKTSGIGGADFAKRKKSPGKHRHEEEERVCN
jgi:hypothetical protein